MDIVSRVEKFPGLGEGVMGPDFKFIPGGKGANQAVAASRLGGNVSFVGKVGNDGFGKTLTAFLNGERLNLHSLVVSKNRPTGMVVVMVDKDGNNMMVGMSGSNFDISINQIKSLQIHASDIVLSTFEISQPITKYLFRKAKAAGAITILNASPLEPARPGILKLADYLIINEHELLFFTKIKNLNKAIKKLVIKGQALIVTLGKNGLICSKDRKLIKIGGHKVKAVDTTAAGDCFLGAFAVAFSENKDLKSALIFANAAASISVQTFGASSSLPHRGQVDKFLKSSI